MIFDNTLTEQQIVENFIKEGGEGKGFIFKSYYDEENNKIILSNLYYDENNIMHEENIRQDKLGIIKDKHNKKKPYRYVMVTGAAMADHPGRLKVSDCGVKIKPNNKNQYISIYRQNKNTISYEGNYRNINMTCDELNQYKNLFERNENLIQFIRYSSGMYDARIDNAIIEDEMLRSQGYIVIRDRNTGSRSVYDSNNNLLYTTNIMEG